MIQANELRIGNYINTPRGIERIKRAECITEVEDYPNNFEPMLITPEILDKCGFRLSQQSYVKIAYNNIERLDSIYVQDIFNFDGKNNIHLEVISDPQTNDIRRIGIEDFNYKGMCGVLNTPIDIKHLHQLQNLVFALTGEELQYTP